MGKSHALDFDEELAIEPPPLPPIIEEVPEEETEEGFEKGSKIIKSGSMEFEVVPLESAKTHVDSLVELHGGYYENEQFKSYRIRNSYSLQIRLPANNFDSFIATLEEGTGKLQSKNIRARDVTEEYQDLNIRLANNLAYLKQYKQILTKAKTVKDILEVQEKIRRIEEEIESKKGRMKYLNDQVKYSSLSLELYETVQKVKSEESFGTRIAHAFQNGIKSMVNVVIALVSFWPFLLIIAILLVLRKPVLNQIRRARNRNGKE